MRLQPGDIPIIETAAARVQEAANMLNAAIISAVAVGLGVELELRDFDYHGRPGKAPTVTARTLFHVGYPEKYAKEGNHG